MNTQETYTVEISSGTILMNRAWADLFNQFKGVLKFLPEVVQTSLEDIIKEIENHKTLLQERKNTLLDIELSKYSALGVGVSYLNNVKGLQAQHEISHEFYNTLMAYVEKRKDLLAELTGLTGNSLVDVIGCALKDITLVEDKDFTVEGIVARFLEAVKPHSHKLVPLTYDEWSTIALKSDSFISSLESAMTLPFIGTTVRKNLRRYIGNKGYRKGYGALDYVRHNMKSDKDDTLVSLGKIPFGKTLIKKLSKKDSFSLSSLFAWVFFSREKKTVEAEVEVTFTSTDPIASVI